MSEQHDILDMEYINSLPQPFLAIEWDEKWKWPVQDIEVQSGMMRIDVCGKLQVVWLTNYKFIEDASGKKHDPESFYFDYR